MPGREEQDRISYVQGDSSDSTLGRERNTSSKVHLIASKMKKGRLLST